MQLEDVLVGATAIGIGTFAIASAVANWEFSYRLWMARAIQRRFGRLAARAFYLILGIVLIVLGGAISVGFAPNSRDARLNGSWFAQAARS